jgi:hypothetical protein
MFVWAALMEGKKFLFLLPVGLALLLCTSVLVASVSPTAFGQQQPNSGGNQNITSTTNSGNNTGTSTAGTLDCDSAASVLRGMVVPNPTGACDIAVPLQGVQVQDTATGASLNNLLIMNPLFEFLPVSNQAAGASSSSSSSSSSATTDANQTPVYGFAEFSLMGGQLPSAMRMLSNSSWNVVAVHNHVIGESPSMIFVHAIANGDINTLAQDTRTILDALMTQMQSSSGNQTSTTAGGGGGTTGGNMTSNSSPGGVTGSTTTGGGSTAGGGVGTFGGGGGTAPGPGVGTSNSTGSSGTTTGGAAGPQVMP